MPMLKGKVAIITGSGRGIGAEIARAFAREGAKVVVSSRHAEECEAVVAGIKKAGGEATFAVCDVSKEADVKALVAKAVAEHGRLDIMVANAGIYEAMPLDTMDAAFWRRVMSIDLDGAFHCTKHAAVEMKKRGSGRIISISSIAGIKGLGMSSAYCAAKGGVLGLMRAAAVDFAPHNITVNAICPGAIETTIGGGFPTDTAALKQMLQPVLIKRIGQPEDIANAAIYLASDGASYVTGAELVVDGGWIAHM